jgi:hypothetical protein
VKRLVVFLLCALIVSCGDDGGDGSELLIEIGLEDCLNLDAPETGTLLTMARDDITSGTRYDIPGGWCEHGITLVLTPEKATEIADLDPPFATQGGFRLSVGLDSYCGMLTFPASAVLINGWVLVEDWEDRYSTLHLTYCLGPGYVDDDDLLDGATVVDVLDRVENILAH